MHLMKEVIHMEYKAYLMKNENERDVLKFDFGSSKSYEIDLNSEDQNSIQQLFYKIIELAMFDKVSFSLDSTSHDKDLFYEVAADYIQKLNNEIEVIRQQIPNEIK